MLGKNPGFELKTYRYLSKDESPSCIAQWKSYNRKDNIHFFNFLLNIPLSPNGDNSRLFSPVLKKWKMIIHNLY